MASALVTRQALKGRGPPAPMWTSGVLLKMLNLRAFEALRSDLCGNGGTVTVISQTVAEAMVEGGDRVREMG